jgi:hypothetical protein
MQIDDFKQFCLEKSAGATIEEQNRILKMIQDINDFLELKLLENSNVNSKDYTDRF